MIPRLSAELRNELSELKGFSERNIKSMLAFYRDYPQPSRFMQQPVAQLATGEKSPQAVTKTAQNKSAKRKTPRKKPIKRPRSGKKSS